MFIWHLKKCDDMYIFSNNWWHLSLLSRNQFGFSTFLREFYEYGATLIKTISTKNCKITKWWETNQLKYHSGGGLVRWCDDWLRWYPEITWSWRDSNTTKNLKDLGIYCTRSDLWTRFLKVGVSLLPIA